MGHGLVKSFFAASATILLALSPGFTTAATPPPPAFLEYIPTPQQECRVGLYAVPLSDDEWVFTFASNVNANADLLCHEIKGTCTMEGTFGDGFVSSACVVGMHNVDITIAGTGYYPAFGDICNACGPGDFGPKATVSISIDSTSYSVQTIPRYWGTG